MTGPPGYDIGDGNCLSMLKCIYDLVQAPRQYYMLFVKFIRRLV